VEAVEKLVEAVRLKHDETQTLSLSCPGSTAFDAVMGQLDFTVHAAEWSDKPGFDSSSLPHTWLDSKEDSRRNREAYMNYLGGIKLPQGTKLLEGSSERQLLSATLDQFGIKLCGNIDVVIVNSAHQSITTARHEILVGIELKKDTNANRSLINRQVTLQHIVASYLNEGTGILTVMTDLRDRWHFLWFSHEGNKRLLQYEATRPEAMFLIEHSQDGEGQSFSTPTSFLSRACWNDLFRSPGLGSIAEEEPSESDRGDEDPGQRSDGNDGGKSLSGTDGQFTSQLDPSSGSGRASHGKTGGSNDGGRKHALMGDISLEYMDEEERFEATLRMALQTSFHNMLYLPEIEEPHSLDVPREISVERPHAVPCDHTHH